jgi:Ca-activated chloride channel family protein
MMTGMQATPSNGGRLVTADGRTLPLRGVSLRAEAQAGVVRAVLVQRFANVFAEPLHVTYLMPLPADGAVSGYAFAIGDRKIIGEVDRKHRARERFEQALSEGRSAGIVVEERSSLFTQELGNIPAGCEVVAELTIDQKLIWMSEGAWEWRFPTAIGPRYQGGPGRVPDAHKIEVAVADGPLPLRLQVELAISDAMPEGDRGGRRVESPSHSLIVRQEVGKHFVELAGESGARLDRDLVVRWAASVPKVGLALSLGRPQLGRPSSESAYALVSLVPPSWGSVRARKRDLILLLDTSGSMGGAPLDQSKKVCAALIDSLDEEDRLEMIEFSDTARRWKRGAVQASAGNKKDAQKWLQKLQSSGGTEMVSGVMEALAPLGKDSQRQVVLLTDGYIGFETEVVKSICDKLPQRSRLHVVGVGSAVNRSLTAPTARAGRGIEVVIGIDEDPERAAQRLVARTAAPLVTEVTLEGDALISAQQRLPDLYAGCPALISAKLAKSGGTLIVRGRTAEGEWSQRMQVAAIEPGQGMQSAAALWARETVEDLELRRAAGKDDVDEQIEKLGLDFQISTRLTTWLAISQEIDVDPTKPTRREIVPQELPHGVSAEGLGLRSVAMPALSRAAMPPAQSITGAFGAVAGAPKAMAPAGPMGVGGGGGRGHAAKKSEERKMKDEGILERVRGIFFDKDDELLDEDTKQGGVSAPSAEYEPWKRKLKARVRLSKDGRVVLEIIVDGDLDWTPPANVAVEFSDGTKRPAPVVANLTTRAGKLTVGQSVRLVIELNRAPVRVSFADLDLEVE